MKLILLVVCFVLSNAQTIPELAEKLGAKTLVNLVKDAGLADTLSGQGPFTVFGPTDAAFAALPPAVLNKLMNDKKLLESVLLFHVLSGKVYSSQLTNDMTAATLNGAKVRVNIYGQTVAVDGSKVILADQNATNGVIHVIDKVLAEIPTQNIVEFAAGQKDFSSLVFLVVSARLGATLSGGPFTLFAPTNEAFNKLPPDAINKLLQNQTALIEVLTYHVVKGTVYSAGLSNGMVPTVEGKSVKVDISSGGVMINNAKVTMADIPVTNGVIHVIDTVLLPPK
ncbi:transforming growth factor-beta-induced protein ig-h3-like [Mytilus edulis]|uniref:transforming growth factor-beta-induced protein ig-h3-like n=1 Tax=Mytilus edulis TaxID=6550 RepID=UPI0039EE5956